MGNPNSKDDNIQVAITIRTDLASNLIESCGRKSIKSMHGTYLRAYKDVSMVDMAPHNQAWEKWYVEVLNGKVVFKAIHSPHKFLRAHPNFNVDLTDQQPREWEQFVPIKSKDGSWSFLSHHGTWLSAQKNGSVSLVNNCNLMEQFWLEAW